MLSTVLIRLTVGMHLLAGGAVCAAEWSGEAAITFKGSSTLHAFGGAVTAAHVRVVTAGTGTSLCWSASGEITVTNMTTAHAGRDAKMWAMLSASKWPTIRAAIPSETPVTAGATSCTVRVEIAGATNDLAAVLSHWQADAAAVSCEIAFPLSLKAFALRPPSVLGLIRVADCIEVQGRIEAKPASGSP